MLSKYTILHNKTKLEQKMGKKEKRGKCKKVKQTQIPPRGMGSGLERSYSKKIFFYYYWLQYQKRFSFIIIIIIMGLHGALSLKMSTYMTETDYLAHFYYKTKFSN